MGRDFDDNKHKDVDGNADYYDYDDEISRKAVGKLLNGLDDLDKKPSKPVVKTVRPQKANEQAATINNSYYDESRAKRSEEEEDEKIVTGFREDGDYPQPGGVDEIDGGEQIGLAELGGVFQEAGPPEDADVSRGRRSRTHEAPADNEERERYRRQFLDGYTDARRKGLDMTQTGDFRKKPSGSTGNTGASADDAVRRISAQKEQAGAPRRRPRPSGGEFTMQQTTQPAKTRRPREQAPDDEINIIPKRTDRGSRERTQPSAAYSPAATSYDAPVFKIIAAVFVVMLVVMIFLIVKVNRSGKTIAEYEAKAAQVQADTETLSTLQTTNDGLRQQVKDLTDSNNSLLLQIQDLESQLADPVSPDSGAGTDGQPSANAQLPGGSQSYTVVSGDSLSRISTRFYGNISGVDAIKQANNLSGDGLQVGQVLIIPASVQ